MSRRQCPRRSALPLSHLPVVLLFVIVVADCADGSMRSIPTTVTTAATTAFLSPSYRSAARGNLRPGRMHRRIQQMIEDGDGRITFSDQIRSDDRVVSGSRYRKNNWLQNSITATQLKARTSQNTDEEESTSSSSISEILILVFPLLLIYVSNQWSRYSISYLVDFSTSTPDSSTASTVVSAYEAMNVDLHFDQSQYGLLASTAFTVLFALSSLIAGNLADRYDRKLLTLGSCAVWTLATLATSQARSYDEVLIARVIMGGACAFAVPAAYTLIADTVSKDKLALSNSIYGSGVYLGGALASLSLLLDGSVGWRGTLGAIGGFGAVSVAAAGLLLPSDGDRGGGANDDDDELMATKEMEQSLATGGNNNAKPTAEGENSLVQNTRQILSIPRVRFLFLASFLRFCSGLMIGVWAAPYYKQAFPSSASEYAVVNALIVGAMGMTSGIMGGYVADGLSAWIEEGDEGDEEGSSPSSIIRENFDEQTVRLLLPIIGSLLAIPCWYLTTHTTSTDAFEVAMLWLAIEYLVAECWFGPTIAVLQSAVGTSRTGTAQGLFVLTGAVGNLAPTLLGWIYGNQITAAAEERLSSVASSSSSSSEVLANLLAWGVCSGYLLSSIFFVVSVRASGEPVGAEGKGTQ